MARIEDIPEPTRTTVVNVPCPTYETTPFVGGPPLSRRRVALVSSAALVARGDPPFAPGSGAVRFLPPTVPLRDLLISHVSINFDRAGFQRDVNVVLPADRLRDMAADGVIGGVADTHYSVMGSTDPAEMVEAADLMAAQMRQESVDAVLLAPV